MFSNNVHMKMVHENQTKHLQIKKSNETEKQVSQIFICKTGASRTSNGSHHLQRLGWSLWHFLLDKGRAPLFAISILSPQASSPKNLLRWFVKLTKQRWMECAGLQWKGEIIHSPSYNTSRWAIGSNSLLLSCNLYLNKMNISIMPDQDELQNRWGCFSLLKILAPGSPTACWSIER